MSSENSSRCCRGERQFTALYLLPYGCHPSADGRMVLDGAGRAVADPASLSADMTIGVCALQPVEMVARFSSGAYGYAHAHEVRLESSDPTRVEFHFDEEYEWSGVEGRQLTDEPVRITAFWLGDESVRAGADITVSPLKEILWLPYPFRISGDGTALVGENGQKCTEIPRRCALRIKDTLLLAAVGRYGDGLYHCMSRSELEFACVDDWVQTDYDADEDWYKVKMISQPDEPGESAEIMLTAMAGDDLFASFWVDAK